MDHGVHRSESASTRAEAIWGSVMHVTVDKFSVYAHELPDKVLNVDGKERTSCMVVAPFMPVDTSTTVGISLKMRI